MSENIIRMVMERAEKYRSREVFRYKNTNEETYKNIGWDDMLHQVQRVAASLLSIGFGPNDNIGLMSENRLEWMLADLGTISVRGVVVPFYSTASRQQLKYIVDETKMKLIFVANHEQYEKALWLLENTKTLIKIIVFEPKIAPNNESCMDWQYFLSLADNEDNNSKLENILNEAQSDDLVKIIYTSGTTGEPKGAMLSHTSFFSAFKIHDERLEMYDTDVSACFLPLSHVFELTWTYYILHCGAINAFIGNPREIIKLLPIIKPTLMCTVPRFFDKTYEGIQMEVGKWLDFKKNIFKWAINTGMKYSESRSNNRKPPLGNRIQYTLADKIVLKKLRNVFGGNIRFMPCAGAAIRKDLLRFFHATGTFITYGYGATETTATVSCFKSDRYDFNSVGTIMPLIEVKISDEEEILVKGKTVFLGYYNKPEETAKALTDGWYHTGDKGAITASYDLIMIDRIKDLIKTSVGKYVSPQKLELLLTQDPYIEQVIIIGDDRKFVSALIVPCFETLIAEAAKLGFEKLNNEELVLRQEMIDFFYDRLDKLQEELTGYEKVVKFHLLSEPFSIQNGQLTNTLKVRRNLLIEQYQDVIEKMYS